MSNGQLAAGSKIYISAATPATYTKAGYEALTWVEIGEVTDISGDIGAMYTSPSYSALGDRGVVKRLGQYDNGSPTIGYKYYRSDAGQEDIAGVVGSNTPSAFKITMTDSDTTVIYFMAIVPGAPIVVGSTEDFIASTVTLGITSESDVLQEDPPA